MTEYPKDIIHKLFLYTARQSNIIFGDPNQIYPSVGRNELSILISKCSDLGDDDSLSLIFSKYDVDSILDNSADVKMPEEDVKKAEEDFIAFMRIIHPDFMKDKD